MNAAMQEFSAQEVDGHCDRQQVDDEQKPSHSVPRK
jgi:hypothetical protein